MKIWMMIMSIIRIFDDCKFVGLSGNYFDLMEVIVVLCNFKILKLYVYYV